MNMNTINLINYSINCFLKVPPVIFHWIFSFRNKEFFKKHFLRMYEQINKNALFLELINYINSSYFFIHYILIKIDELKKLKQ